MNNQQLDQRAINKVSGPAWQNMRPTFDVLTDALLSVDATSRGELTTIYVKFTSSETAGRPYAVLWLRKATELTLGLALPDGVESPLLVGAPRGCKYAGLTRYLVLRQGDGIPDSLAEWSRIAHDTMQERTGG